MLEHSGLWCRWWLCGSLCGIRDVKRHPRIVRAAFGFLCLSQALGLWIGEDQGHVSGW